jgi:hypothetical protein
MWHNQIDDIEEGYKITIGHDPIPKDKRDMRSLTSQPVTSRWWYDPDVTSDEKAVEMIKEWMVSRIEQQLKWARKAKQVEYA